MNFCPALPFSSRKSQRLLCRWSAWVLRYCCWRCGWQHHYLEVWYGCILFFWDGMLMGWWNDGWVLQGATVQIDRVFDRVPQWTLNEKQRNSVTVQLWLSLVNMRSLWKFSRIESTMWQQKYLQDLSGIMKLDTPDFFRLMYGCGSGNFRSNWCPPLWTVSTY